MAEETTGSRTTFQRDADFTSLYANHVWYALTIWDLKLVFGQLDEIDNTKFIEQHTAITLPWLQAKLMSYFLQVNVAIYEHQHGPIAIPPVVFPPEPAAELGKDLIDKIQEIRKRFSEGQ